jgi:hypothetical protein
MDEEFEFLVVPSYKFVSDTASHKCDGAGLPRCFMYIDRDVKVAAFVFSI